MNNSIKKNSIDTFKCVKQFLKKKYKILNVRNYRELTKYIFNIINHSKNLDFYNVFNQLTFAYKKIDVKLKQILKPFISNIIVEQFMNQLKKNDMMKIIR